MLSCLVPRFGQEDMPSSTKFDLQFPPLTIARNDDDSSHNSEFINCTHCQLEFSTFQSLKDHIMQVHQQPSESPTASMNGMAQRFSPPPSLLSPGHFPYNLNTGANEGGRQSRSPNNLNTHACSYNQCSASFPTLELLEKHDMIQHSSGATNVCCRLCHKTFANVYRLQRHMISHDESALLRKFKCTDCDKAFKFKHHLKEHLRIHSGEKPFGCPNCGKRFSHSGSYSSHMTSKKCISMGLKMNGTSLAANNNNNNNNLNGTKNKSEKKQHLSMASAFVNQSHLANAGKFMNGGMGTTNPIFPMLPNYGDNYDVAMNAALFASLSNPFYQMGLNPAGFNPYHIQSLLKFTGVHNLNKQIEEEMQKTNESHKNPNQHSNPEDLIEEVNEQEESKLVMDLKDEKVPKEEKNVDNEFDEDEAMHDGEASSLHDSREKSQSPVAKRFKREPSFHDDTVSDSLRCQHCDKIFNHPTELLQHEKMLCNAIHLKSHEGLMAQMVESLNNSSTLNAGSEDDNDDRDSKMSTESERKVRVRTAISEEQQAVLKDYYAINARPNRDDFRNIAQRLMLDPRVVQVWFQNNRSRERKQNGALGQFKATGTTGEDLPLDLSMKKEMTTETPTTSPRYGAVPMQQSPEEVLNLSRKIAPFSPIFQQNYNNDFISRQIPSPNEAVPRLSNVRNGYGLPLGLPLERLLQFTPEMIMMKQPENRGNSLSPGSSEKRSWKDDESRSYDEAMSQSHQYQSQRRMPKMKSEVPPDSDEFNFVCDLCDKAFRKQSSLARHKYEHSGQRPFKCTECPKAFKHRHHLTEHKRLHTGEKPFQCNKCTKRFSHSGSYSQHMNHRYSYCKPFRD